MILRVLCTVIALCVLCDVRGNEEPVPALLVQSGADGAAWAAAARLLARALSDAGAGGGARAAPAGPCAAAADAPRCLRRRLAAARRGGGGVVLALPVAAAAAGHTARRLRALGLADLGDAAPPARRACVLLPPAPAAPLLSLQQLQAPPDAAQFALPAAALREMLQGALAYNESTSYWCGADEECVNRTFTPQWCSDGGGGAPCADVLVGDAGELRVMAGVVRRGGLRARLWALGPRLADVAAAAAATAIRPVIACGWRSELPPLPELAPPPCVTLANTDVDADADVECPFEPRRLLKVAAEAALARWPRAARVLDRFWLEEGEVRALGAEAAREGAAAAAARWHSLPLAARWAPGAAPPPYVLALVPPQDEPGALAVAAAAAFAEETLQLEAPMKVQVSEAGCSSERVFRVTAEALGGGEFGALAALAGPACAGGGASGGGALAAALRVPALAYTAAAAAPGGWRLLAGGEAAAAATAAGRLLADHGWRRVAVLSQGAPLHAATQGLHVLLHVDLPDADSADPLIEQWASRAAALDARILLVGVEDARVLRAALCAGAGAGLVPAAGVVWVLLAPPALLPPLPAACAAAADHRLAVRWEWPAPAPAWRAGLARHCARFAALTPATPAVAAAAACAADARAALLYDALQLWARALRRLKQEDPAALDHLHNPDVARKLIAYTTTANYTGQTGPFEWGPAEEEAGDALMGARLGATSARRGTLLVTQWRGGAEHAVARWDRRRAALTALAEPRWLMADGRAPGDGAACALGELGTLLGSCAAALLATATLALALLLAALGGGALYGKRRLERRFRARLAALARAPPHVAADRWELPRQHVVINRRLGGGAFGAVYGGHARLAAPPGEPERWTAVAVKMLRPGASTDEKVDFLAEAEAMKRLEHPNVVRLLGVVTQSEPVCCVMEFALYGDLKGYLLARRGAAGEGEAEGGVSAERLTALARDAARALSYLAARRVLHRDVAARNCLVTARGALKLADFGMARRLFEREYYRFGRRGLLPVRWMAPEALAGGLFSTASDVWALGVLLLEIVTFGALPYAALNNRQVLAHVAAGGSPPLPPGAPPPLAGLLRACWARAAAARPAASEVAAWLGGGRLLTPCLAAPAPAPREDAPADGADGGWWGGGGGGSAGTDSTYLSDAPPHAPLLP